MDQVERLPDSRDFDEAMQKIASGEEVVPDKLVYAILDGENPIKVWREYRGLTQQALARQAGISAAYLSQIESGKRTGSAEVLGAIAAAPDLTLDEIV